MLTSIHIGSVRSLLRSLQSIFLFDAMSRDRIQHRRKSYKVDFSRPYFHFIELYFSEIY